MKVFTQIRFTSIFLWPFQWSMKFISEVSCCIRYKIRKKGYNSYIVDGSKVEYPRALLFLYAEVHSLTAETQNVQEQELTSSLATTIHSLIVCSEIRFQSGVLWNTNWWSYISLVNKFLQISCPITGQSLSLNHPVLVAFVQEGFVFVYPLKAFLRAFQIKECT